MTNEWVPGRCRIRKEEEVACLGCGTWIEGDIREHLANPGHVKVYLCNVAWVRAYQAGGGWREAIDFVIRQALEEHHDLAMACELPLEAE